MTIATSSYLNAGLRTEAEARAKRASLSEGNALQACVDLSCDLTTLIIRAQALRKVEIMPSDLVDVLDSLINMLDDASHDANVPAAVERYEEAQPARDAARVTYAREIARDPTVARAALAAE